MDLIFIAIIFFTIAVLYSSVGFGGGSSYIAILLLAGLAIEEVRFTALVCNIIVVSGSTFNYFKAGLIPWKKVLPIVLISVPMAFLGGMLRLDSSVYKLVASLALITASLLMFRKNKENNKKKVLSTSTLSGIGGGIGFLSGTIGIGGGIFLAPILHLIKWESVKLISATASMFILVNSLAGITGQLTNQLTIDIRQIIILGLCVLIGGQIGNHLNMKVLKAENIRLMTAVLVGFVGIRILIAQLMS